MEQEKPFKTIEVIDSRTNQTCKVACMSCIRGHRTTSCGIPVCRTKIFWTVKRPGRPSNSCTCRYGATGGCKCVVARSACPHKSKKGEKRSGECRCDEQGRYCCLIEPDHWNLLLSLQKPVVDFYPTREALEAKQRASTSMSIPQTPAYSSITSPPSTNSMPSTPAPQGRMPPLHILPNNYNGYPPPPMSSGLTPRFGMMGIGAPMGDAHNPPDQLVWEGQAPIAPREFNAQPMYEEQGSCCQASTPSAQSVHSPAPRYEPTFSQPQQDQAPIPQSYGGIHETVSLSQVSTPAPAPFNFDKLQMDYFNYQFPSAICQNCGLNGCTCRNCPPVFQNFGTTSWAQCCGRKHARDVQPAGAAEPQKIARTEKYDASQGIHAQTPAATTAQSYQSPNGGMAQPAFGINGTHSFGEGFEEMELPPDLPPDFDNFDIPPDLMLNGHEPIDLNEFLISDLDRINQGGLDNLPPDIPPDIPSSEPPGGAGGGGGGCCCGGD